MAGAQPVKNDSGFGEQEGPSDLGDGVEYVEYISILDGKTVHRTPLNPGHGYRHDRSIKDFEKLNIIGEGTYGIVYKARDKVKGKIVAVKRLRKDPNHSGISLGNLREMVLLTRLNHENVVTLHETVLGHYATDYFLVMEYVEQDLASLLDNMKHPFTEAQVKCILKQMLKGVAYLHSEFVVHRDLKVSNLLLTDKGILKIADFGLAREYSDPPSPMTPNVVTLWYRSPELLLGAREQTGAVDMWAVGCIFGELLLHEPLLPGKTEIGQLHLIVELIGAPNDTVWPGYSSLPATESLDFSSLNKMSTIKTRFPSTTESNEAGLELLQSLFIYNPLERITAKQCITSPYFDIKPRPCACDMMPTFRHHRDK